MAKHRKHKKRQSTLHSSNPGPSAGSLDPNHPPAMSSANDIGDTQSQSSTSTLAPEDVSPTSTQEHLLPSPADQGNADRPASGDSSGDDITDQLQTLGLERPESPTPPGIPDDDQYDADHEENDTEEQKIEPAPAQHQPPARTLRDYYEDLKIWPVPPQSGDAYATFFHLASQYMFAYYPSIYPLDTTEPPDQDPFDEIQLAKAFYRAYGEAIWPASEPSWDLMQERIEILAAFFTDLRSRKLLRGGLKKTLDEYLVDLVGPQRVSDTYNDDPAAPPASDSSDDASDNPEWTSSDEALLAILFTDLCLPIEEEEVQQHSPTTTTTTALPIPTLFPLALTHFATETLAASNAAVPPNARRPLTPEQAEAISACLLNSEWSPALWPGFHSAGDLSAARLEPLTQYLLVLSRSPAWRGRVEEEGSGSETLFGNLVGRIGDGGNNSNDDDDIPQRHSPAQNESERIIISCKVPIRHDKLCPCICESAGEYERHLRQAHKYDPEMARDGAKDAVYDLKKGGGGDGGSGL